MSTPPSDRTYSEREVAAIFERAVARQEAAQRSRAEAGLSLADLERVARETGIDPEHLRAAVADVERGAGLDRRSATQTNTHVKLERWIDGAFDDAAWEDAVTEVEQGLGTNYAGTMYYTQPRHQQVGRTREWRHVSAMGVVTEASVSQRDGGMRLRLSAHVGFASPVVEGWLLALFPAIVAGLVAGGASGMPWLGVLAFVVALAVAGPLITGADRRWREKKRRGLEATADLLTDRLAEAAARAGAPAAATPAAAPLSEVPVETAAVSAPPQPALDLDRLGEATLPPEDEREGDAVRPRRTRS